jgi:outer membrane murein-binding lipoprotein Lpp
MSTTEIIVTLSVGFTLLWSLSLWLLKMYIAGVFAEVKRMGGLVRQEWFDEISSRVKELPGKRWFDEVHERLKGLPDPDRLADHFKRVHELGNDVNVLSLRYGDLRSQVDDMRKASARLEERVAKNEGRVDARDAQDRRSGRDGPRE